MAPSPARPSPKRNQSSRPTALDYDSAPHLDATRTTGSPSGLLSPDFASRRGVITLNPSSSPSSPGGRGLAVPAAGAVSDDWSRGTDVGAKRKQWSSATMSFGSSSSSVRTWPARGESKRPNAWGAPRNDFPPLASSPSSRSIRTRAPAPKPTQSRASSSTSMHPGPTSPRSTHSSASPRSTHSSTPKLEKQASSPVRPPKSQTNNSSVDTALYVNGVPLFADNDWGGAVWDTAPAPWDEAVKISDGKDDWGVNVQSYSGSPQGANGTERSTLDPWDIPLPDEEGEGEEEEEEDDDEGNRTWGEADNGTWGEWGGTGGEWEVTPVWEDGAVRDVEPSDADSDSGRPNTALVNAGDLPSCVPRIVCNDPTTLEAVLNTSSHYIGVAAVFNDKSRVSAVVLATSQIIFIANLADLYNEEPESAAKDEAILSVLSKILGRKTPSMVALELGRVALCIHRDLALHVQGIDLSSSVTGSTRMFYQPEKMAGMLKEHTFRSTLKELGVVLSNQGKPDKEGSPSPMAMAIAAALFAALYPVGGTIRSEKVVRLDTSKLEDEELRLLGDMQLQTDIAELVRPESYEADFVMAEIKGRDIRITNARYATKVRAHMEVMITFADGTTCPGKAEVTYQRETLIRIMDGTVPGPDAVVTAVTVLGGDMLSNSEVAKRDWMVSMLHKPVPLAEKSIIIRCLWFPTSLDIAMISESVAASKKIVEHFDDWNLNLDDSQKEVAAVMCCPEYPLVLTHGPPGAGKTRTICAAVQDWSSRGQTAWLVCQSNVGVKNIAESLTRSGFTNYKLLVSGEFYSSWHESIYIEVNKNVMRLEQMPDKPDELRHHLRGFPVVLCTLSMLSNPSLIARGLFNIVPVQNLVIDEASQIFVGDYVHVFYRFASKLKKVCWFGDPNQLPPFGSDNAEGLSTVFDLPHLKDSTHFLGTTYRVPFALNQFLSYEVYGGKLGSRFSKNRSTSVLKFIDVKEGEETGVGTSWRNVKEAETIVNLVVKYYHSTNFVVLTPYDAQRACIDQMLRQQNLDWKGKVFNVDSFQGNEADYILVSLTRTTRPGFLVSTNRSNVMLSRCKRGMVVVSRKSFLHRKDLSQTLVGRLADRWERDHPTSPWVDWRDVSLGKVDMPGVRGSMPPNLRRGWQGDDHYGALNVKKNSGKGMVHVTFTSLYPDVSDF